MLSFAQRKKLFQMKECESTFALTCDVLYLSAPTYKHLQGILSSPSFVDDHVVI